MTYSYTTASASAGQHIVNVSFPYRNKTDVHVLIDGVELTQNLLEWTSVSQIDIATANGGPLTLNQVIRVYRETPASNPAVTFQAGPIKHSDLNTGILQLLYIVQEAYDIALIGQDLLPTVEADAAAVSDALVAITAMHVQISDWNDAVETAKNAAQAAATAAAASAATAASDAEAAVAGLVTDVTALKDAAAASAAAAQSAADDTANDVLQSSANADNAAGYATDASGFADAADASATASSGYATAAAAAKVAAEAARDSALAAYDSFDDRYLGQKATAPTLDNDGNALGGGALYYSSEVGNEGMKVWTGSAWVSAYVAGGSSMDPSNNLSELTSPSTARVNLGLGNVDNTSDAAKPVSTATQTALDLKLDYDADLNDIGALTPTNDDVMQRKGGHWVNRTIAQLKTDLAYATSEITEVTNLFFTETRVRAAVLTGLSTATNAAVVAADSILVAIGKLQAHLAANDTSIAALPTASSTTTFTNKRVTKRVFSEASNATPAPDADAYDEHHVTAAAAGMTVGAPSGTPTDGQNLIFRFKDNGTPRSIAWNAIFRAFKTLPTVTITSKTKYVGFKWNAADSKWDCLAVADEA